MPTRLRNSRFAHVVENEGATSVPYDQVVLRTENFAVVPSAGSLVPGWLLVIPLRPMLNLGHLDLSERRELSNIVLDVGAKLSAFEDNIYCFEHGSGWYGSATGCGVDHAHLHIVPLKFDLVAAVQEAATDDIQWEAVAKESEQVPILPAEGEYIAVWQVPSDLAMVSKLKRQTSQWIRRIIARQVGLEAEWNYQTHPQLANVRQTLATLGHSIQLNMSKAG